MTNEKLNATLNGQGGQPGHQGLSRATLLLLAVGAVLLVATLTLITLKLQQSAGPSAPASAPAQALVAEGDRESAFSPGQAFAAAMSNCEVETGAGAFVTRADGREVFGMSILWEPSSADLSMDQSICLLQQLETTQDTVHEMMSGPTTGQANWSAPLAGPIVLTWSRDLTGVMVVVIAEQLS